MIFFEFVLGVLLVKSNVFVFELLWVMILIDLMMCEDRSVCFNFCVSIVFGWFVLRFLRIKGR